MATGLFRRVGAAQQQELETRLEELSKPSFEFFVLLGSSTIIAVLGLFQDSAAVIIGAMIIAPLMRPLMGLALGSISADQKLIVHSIVTLLFGTAVGLSIAYVGAFLLHSIQLTPEILGRTHPNLLDLGVALAAGAVGAYCQSKAEIRDTLAGVAISVALVPPLSVVGIGLARGDYSVAGGAALLYLTNLVGITAAAAAVLIMMGYSPLNRARTAIFASIAFMATLLVPLGLSMRELVLENELSYQINSLLKNKTFTFKNARLHSVEVKRFKSPMEVVATVYGAEEEFKPKQVKAVQEFLVKNTGVNLRFRLRVIPLKEIQAVEVTPELSVDVFPGALGPQLVSPESKKGQDEQAASMTPETIQNDAIPKQNYASDPQSAQKMGKQAADRGKPSSTTSPEPEARPATEDSVSEDKAQRGNEHKAESERGDEASKRVDDRNSK